jgi:very-short-patch-repair endonuclease
VNYVDSSKKVMITCPIHSPINGDFPQSPSEHLSGRGCPWCNKSKGEKMIEQILHTKNINYIQFKKYDDCISYRSKNGLNKQCKKLIFDFYLPENNTLVEFDGIYHFEKKDRKQLKYMYQALNDREKNEYTKINSIKLIRIGYLDIKNIEEELMKGLDSNDQLYLSTKYPIDKGWRDTTIKV